ncbi:hypothetical protein GCM10017687_73570 [Streptomyces echinatus]
MRIVLCLLLAVGAGEPVRFFHVRRTGEILTGALSGSRGIVKRVQLTSVSDFYADDATDATERYEERSGTRDAQRVRDRDRPG